MALKSRICAKFNFYCHIYQVRVILYVFGDFWVISGFWAHFMAILGPNLAKNGQNSNNGTKFASFWAIKSQICVKFNLYCLIYQFSVVFDVFGDF